MDGAGGSAASGGIAGGPGGDVFPGGDPGRAGLPSIPARRARSAARSIRRELLAEAAAAGSCTGKHVSSLLADGGRGVVCLRHRQFAADRSILTELWAQLNNGNRLEN